MSSCNFFSRSALVLFFGLSGHATESVVLKKIVLQVGAVPTMYTAAEARVACPAGTHLPTLRELANFAVSQGAKPILEENEVDFNHPPAGYNRIRAMNGAQFWDDSEAVADHFYFNPEGFQGLPEELKSLTGLSVWSSSIYESSNPFQYYLNFNSQFTSEPNNGFGGIGSDFIGGEGRFKKRPVMCFANR